MRTAIGRQISAIIATRATTASLVRESIIVLLLPSRMYSSSALPRAGALSVTEHGTLLLLGLVDQIVNASRVDGPDVLADNDPGCVQHDRDR